MPFSIVAMTAMLTLLATQPQASPQKPAPADAGNARIVWFDLSTPDLAKSKEFYGKLFDWTFAPVQGTEFAVEIVSGGTAIGTLRGAEGKLSPFNGVVYVQVADVQATCAKAKELGGTIPPGFPFNLPDRPGAIALIVEPGGHPIGVYSRNRIPAAPAVK